MKKKFFAIILFSAVAYLHGSDKAWTPDTFPQPENTPLDVIKTHKGKYPMKVLFKGIDISNETKSFKELGVRSFYDLVYRLSIPENKLYEKPEETTT